VLLPDSASLRPSSPEAAIFASSDDGDDDEGDEVCGSCEIALNSFEKYVGEGFTRTGAKEERISRFPGQSVTVWREKKCLEMSRVLVKWRWSRPRRH